MNRQIRQIHTAAGTTIGGSLFGIAVSFIAVAGMFFTLAMILGD